MSIHEKTVTGTWCLEQTSTFSRLVIEEGADILAPEGKYLVMTVNGRSTPIAPGTYEGKVVLTLADLYTREISRFGRKGVASFHTGVFVKDGKYLENYSVPALVQHGTVSDHSASDLYMNTREWDLNGFYITGNTDYTIDNMTMLLTGDGTDDFSGRGAGIAVSGSSKVTVNNAEIHSFGISRSAAYVGDQADVTFNDCFFTMDSGIYTQQELDDRQKGEHRMLTPPWGMGFSGHGRVTNQAGNSRSTYNRCHIMSNSWGCLSIDGGVVTRMHVKDSLLELTGESGYGVFSIADDSAFDYKSYGDFGCFNTIDHSVIKGVTYPIVMSLGNAGGEFINGSKIYGKYGCLCFRNDGGHLNVTSKTLLETELSSFLCKGATSHFLVDDAELKPGNGIIMQLMDNDETGMGGDPFTPPHGEVDTPIAGRDLTSADPTEDVFLTIANSSQAGNIYNSTTNLLANCRQQRKPRPGGAGGPSFGGIRGMGTDLQGPKNLSVTLKHAQLTGAITSAKQEYPSYIRQINKDNYQALSAVTLTAQPPVNNGVIVSLEAGSHWTVPETCYLTALTLDDTSSLRAPEGMQLQMTVNGEKTIPTAGSYVGNIVLTVND